MPTKIEWAEETWNPVTGCTPISAGCENCYARRMAARLRGRCGYPEDDPFKVTLHPDRMEQPLRWQKSRRVFVCSMGDLFHEDVPFKEIACVFGIMAACPQHTFMVLTKRPDNIFKFFEWLERMAESKSMTEVFPDDNHEWRCRHLMKAAALRATGNGKVAMQGLEGWPLPNVWLGVTAENQETADERIPTLLKIPAAVRFVSVEPMLGPIDLMSVRFDRHTRMNVLEGCGTSLKSHCQAMPNVFCKKLDWVICGGESGPRARPMHPDWARSLRDQCQAAGVPFFFKQWGEWGLNWLNGDDGKIEGSEWMDKMGRRLAGRLLDGREWNEYPGTCVRVITERTETHECDKERTETHSGPFQNGNNQGGE